MVDVKIYIDTVYGKVRNDRKGVIVEITNHKGEIYKYMPSYKHLREIERLLKEAERLNEKDKKARIVHNYSYKEKPLSQFM